MSIHNTANQKSNELLELLITYLYESYIDCEEWREIEGTNGKYFVSNQGRVLSLCLHKAHLLNPFVTNGYYYVSIKVNGEWYNKKVHQLVAQAFLEADSAKPIIHHKDFNKRNNRASNLERVSAEEHGQRHTKSKEKEEAENGLLSTF